jgi:hypothetical protein
MGHVGVPRGLSGFQVTDGPALFDDVGDTVELGVLRKDGSAMQIQAVRVELTETPGEGDEPITVDGLVTNYRLRVFTSRSPDFFDLRVAHPRSTIDASDLGAEGVAAGYDLIGPCPSRRRLRRHRNSLIPAEAF